MLIILPEYRMSKKVIKKHDFQQILKLKKKARFLTEASENKTTNEENNADESEKKEDSSKKTLNENDKVETKVAVAK